MDKIKKSNITDSVNQIKITNEMLKIIYGSFYIPHKFMDSVIRAMTLNEIKQSYRERKAIFERMNKIQ